MVQDKWLIYYTMVAPLQFFLIGAHALNMSDLYLNAVSGL